MDIGNGHSCITKEMRIIARSVRCKTNRNKEIGYVLEH